MQPGFCKNAGSAAGNDLICQNLGNNDVDGSKNVACTNMFQKFMSPAIWLLKPSRNYSMKVKNQL